MEARQRTLDGWLGVQSPRAPVGHTPGTRVAPSPNNVQAQRRERRVSQSNPVTHNSGSSSEAQRRRTLRQTAQETLDVLPTILAPLTHVHASRSTVYTLSSLPPLSAQCCPHLPRTAIEILPVDSINAAITISTRPPSAASGRPSSPGRTSTNGNSSRRRRDNPRVAVLNMASHTSPGGGWINGALAQEEALCYRSSLSLSLHRRYYPWRKQRMGIYTGHVVVVRDDMASGHGLLVPHVRPEDLPVVSVLSVAALRDPATRVVRGGGGATTRSRPQSQGHADDERGDSGDEDDTEREEVFAHREDRALTRDKMRLCLRMAAHWGHRKIVLGALGCGAFHNPRGEVAGCWREVFQEAEFRGGWWERVVFAVLDTKREGNLETFQDVLGGLLV